MISSAYIIIMKVSASTPNNVIMVATVDHERPPRGSFPGLGVGYDRSHGQRLATRRNDT